jgi:hypothetical protein
MILATFCKKGLKSKGVFKKLKGISGRRLKFERGRLLKLKIKLQEPVGRRGRCSRAFQGKPELMGRVKASEGDESAGF